MMIHLERFELGREFGSGCFDSVETGLLNACLEVGRCAAGRRVLDDGKCIDCLAAAAAAFGESGDDSPSQETLARPKELAEDAVKRGRPSPPSTGNL